MKSVACHRIIHRIIVLVATLLVAAVAGAESPEPAAGKRLYRIYCQSCHGEGGEGDGPVAEALKARPADLTRLSDRNDGEYPQEKVEQSIDGRAEVPAHGPREMPVWGLSFQDPSRDSNQENEVEAKIRDLVAYIESIQREPQNR